MSYSISGPVVRNYVTSWVLKTEAVVADQPAREADQDRPKGGQSWPLRYLPDGRGRSLATDVRRNPVLDRPVASTTRAGMRSQGDQMREPRGETHAAIKAKRRVSALRCRQLPASIASCPRRGQFAAVRAGQGGDSDLKTARNRLIGAARGRPKKATAIAIEKVL